MATATRPASTFVRPNFAQLATADQSVRIGYADAQLGETLTLSDANGDRTFSVREGTLTAADSPLGRLLTAQVEAVPDLQTTTLTLLLPQINVRFGTNQGGGVRFRTLAILTQNRTSIGGPGLVAGVLQSYRVLRLRGTASSVVF